ncbi:CBU_0592 family membrane protein [Isoptericola aurantiacus]|uniref:CBU_0592 family membrane protein n=1 Tax=Isoptericola aurantiacus TaxID=3377839 RepID=UPI00383A1D35
MLPYLLSVVTALGWVGAIIGLVAYIQVSRGRWAPNSIQFQAANLCATSMLFLVAAVNGVWPSVAANIAWMVIGGQAILVIVKARHDRRRTQAADLATVEMPLVDRPLDLTDAERVVERTTERHDGEAFAHAHRLVAAVR